MSDNIFLRATEDDPKMICQTAYVLYNKNIITTDKRHTTVVKSMSIFKQSRV